MTVDGMVINTPTIAGAPVAKSPRKFKTDAEARASQERLGRMFRVRSMSSTRGASFTPGGGRRKIKKGSRKMPK